MWGVVTMITKMDGRNFPNALMHFSMRLSVKYTQLHGKTGRLKIPESSPWVLKKKKRSAE